jgi:hypothetical protein
MSLSSFPSLYRRTDAFKSRAQGYLSLHEAYFYIFDALPLWIAMSLYCVVWPVRALVDSEHPGGDHELASVVRSSG